jgi:hypothetical protein
MAFRGFAGPGELGSELGQELAHELGQELGQELGRGSCPGDSCPG